MGPSQGRKTKPVMKHASRRSGIRTASGVHAELQKRSPRIAKRAAGAWHLGR